MWHLATALPLFTLRTHFGAVNRVEFTAEGRRLVSQSENDVVKIWDARPGNPVPQELKFLRSDGMVVGAVRDSDPERKGLPHRLRFEDT
jgi:hypothetical protein